MSAMEERLKWVRELSEGDRFVFNGVERVIKKAEDGLLYFDPELDGPLYHDSVVEVILDTPSLEETVEAVDEIQQALDRGFEPGRLWLANDKEGNTLAQTSNPEDFRHLGLMDRDDVVIFRRYAKVISEWVKETPEV